MSTDFDTEGLPTEPYTVIEVTWLNDLQQPPLIEQYVLMPTTSDEGWVCLFDHITWDLRGEPIEWRVLARPVTTENEETSDAAAHQ
jgi:hypothetical protein